MFSPLGCLQDRAAGTPFGFGSRFTRKWPGATRIFPFPAHKWTLLLTRMTSLNSERCCFRGRSIHVNEFVQREDRLAKIGEGQFVKIGFRIA